ncbi:uncharacterized protein LOC115440579 [Manduca sexta]|uniref:Uncharacterized protein n=1 Tax=Manduca sexta TaxID=7130 RepID=A0A921YVJ1_MANSE|nr:uncharacterized protein LOC115440579 [Manduca sexta]KAG6445584.1 hypothetical protein O3G_MSEX003986 [Manduca sexta]
MGYIIRSHRMLTLAEVTDSLVKNYKINVRNNETPLAHLRNRLDGDHASPFYMECVRQNPFEYLILNSAEVDQLIQTSMEHNVSLEDLCKVLARRDRNDDRDDYFEPSDSDEEEEAEAAIGPQPPWLVRGPNNELEENPRFQDWAQRAIRVSPAAAGEYESWAVPGIAGMGIDEFETWVLREIAAMPANNAGADGAAAGDNEAPVINGEPAGEPGVEAVVNNAADAMEAAN